MWHTVAVGRPRPPNATAAACIHRRRIRSRSARCTLQEQSRASERHADSGQPQQRHAHAPRSPGGRSSRRSGCANRSFTLFICTEPASGPLSSVTAGVRPLRALAPRVGMALRAQAQVSAIRAPQGSPCQWCQHLGGGKLPNARPMRNSTLPTYACAPATADPTPTAGGAASAPPRAHQWVRAYQKHDCCGVLRPTFTARSTAPCMVTPTPSTRALSSQVARCSSRAAARRRCVRG